MWAYPRSRGGTAGTALNSILAQGLSPLARGNRGVSAAMEAGSGPIPARAGEPRWPRRSSRCSGAYPRSRGGTVRDGRLDVLYTGLSPLARGNRHRARRRRTAAGPIPARAGEPNVSPRLRDAITAYPRSRGGTEGAKLPGRLAKGLSPLARGNLGHSPARPMDVGPIPARAGEPCVGVRRLAALRAYPRSRGGTRRRLLEGAVMLGLSPLARGNHDFDAGLLADVGPIPARAGEPHRFLRSPCPGWAYPRSRGGT